MKAFFLLVAMIMQIQARAVPLIYVQSGSAASPEPTPYFADYHADSVIAIAPPASGSAAFASGFYPDGTTITWRIYAYKIVAGTRYYSPTYRQVTFFTEDANGAQLTWAAVPGASGYRILQDNDHAPLGFNFYQDVEDGVTLHDEDDEIGWQSGNTVTPSQSLVLVDQSGNGRHAPWNGVGTAPTLEATAWFNGTPAVRFTGRPCITAAFAAQSALSWVCAFRNLAIPSGLPRRVVEAGDGSTTRMAMIASRTSASNRWSMQQGISGATLSTTDGSAHTNPVVIGCVFAGAASSTIGCNGINSGAGILGASSVDKLAIGGGPSGAVGSSIDFRALRVWNRVLTPDELVTEMQNFQNQHMTPFTFNRKTEAGEFLITEASENRIQQ